MGVVFKAPRVDSVENRFDFLVRIREAHGHAFAAVGVAEKLKSYDRVRWLGLTNNRIAHAEEIILADLILCIGCCSMLTFKKFFQCLNRSSLKIEYAGRLKLYQPHNAEMGYPFLGVDKMHAGRNSRNATG